LFFFFKISGRAAAAALKDELLFFHSHSFICHPRYVISETDIVVK